MPDAAADDRVDSPSTDRPGETIAPDGLEGLDRTDGPDGPDDNASLDPGIGLCLSGGGYRAMLFHVGALLRLNELKLLPKIKRISSVSGGSITAATLGMNWQKLDFQRGSPNEGVASNLIENLVDPIRGMASTTIDRGSVMLGTLLPGYTIGDMIASSYRKILFGAATLKDLPPENAGPRFVINATNVQTGSLVRFSRKYAADYKVGVIDDPEFDLATVVAASSAFPPVLSPVTLDVNPSRYRTPTNEPLAELPYTDDWVLSDGGVYDNLGLETVHKNFKVVLVSDAGAKLQAEPFPAVNWAEHSIRILGIIDDQVRNLRKRWLMRDYATKERLGCYWGIGQNLHSPKVPDQLASPFYRTDELAKLPTRLKAMDESLQNRLMNWGYTACDAMMRKWATAVIPPGFTAPSDYPFPSAGI